MAIAPITGTLKKRAATDISIGFAIGLVGGCYWWWGYHKNKVNLREKYYQQLAAEKAAEDA